MAQLNTTRCLVCDRQIPFTGPSGRLKRSDAKTCSNRCRSLLRRLRARLRSRQSQADDDGQVSTDQTL